MVGQDRWAKEMMAAPLEDVAAAAVGYGMPDSRNAMAAELVVQVRSALESARAAEASRETAKATRRLVVATWVMAIATLALAVVTVATLLTQSF